MLPHISIIDQAEDMIDRFGGYNHSETVSDGQFYEMTNLSADSFPALCARKRRDFIKEIESPNGIFFADSLVYVDGTEFWYNGSYVMDLSDTEKTIVSMGAYLCIWPDKVVFNTETGEWFEMEAHYRSVGRIVVEPCTLNGSSMEYSTSEPNHTDGAYWLDDGTLKQWSDTYGTWMPVATSYVRICEYIGSERNVLFGEEFAEGDTVTFEGFSDEDMNGDFSLYKCEDGYMVIGSSIKDLDERNITIDRSVPDIDYVCECNNRLWGVSAKRTEEKGHEIYACKLGDPKNWRAYAGLVSDSFAVTVGSYGDFTGCVNYMGNVLFFKEGSIVKIYGTQPSNFTMTEVSCRGVEKGSSKSLAVVNGILYYKSKEGICAYDGSMPSLISSNLGNERYKNATAGGTVSKYYISMDDSRGGHHVFVYDQLRGIWLREDDEHMKMFTSDAGTLYYINYEGLNVIRTLDRGKGIYPGVEIFMNGRNVPLYPGMAYPGQIFDDDYENPIEWSAETGDMCVEYPENKYVSKIILRLMVEFGGKFELYIQYDSDGVWDKVLQINHTRKRSVYVPVRLRRCDHIRLKICGQGYFKLYSISKFVERGSEV